MSESAVTQYLRKKSFRSSSSSEGSPRKPTPSRSTPAFFHDDEDMQEEIRSLKRKLQGLEAQKSFFKEKITSAESQLLQKSRANLTPVQTPSTSRTQSQGRATFQQETSMIESARYRVKLLEASIVDRETEMAQIKMDPSYQAAISDDMYGDTRTGRTHRRHKDDLRERILGLKAMNGKVREENDRLAEEAVRWSNENDQLSLDIIKLERQVQKLPEGRSIGEVQRELTSLRETLKSKRQLLVDQEVQHRQRMSEYTERMISQRARVQPREQPSRGFVALETPAPERPTPLVSDSSQSERRVTSPMTMYQPYSRPI
mmetsp:Transcript_20874/g.34408  ORF Transcript_20874/g.34408 Transcript_20874/m.34408 type:complete len:316 (-) Transcript_20874:702-1649(-)